MFRVPYKQHGSVEAELGGVVVLGQDVGMVEGILSMPFPYLYDFLINGLELAAIVIFVLIIRGMMPPTMLYVAAPYWMSIVISVYLASVSTDFERRPKFNFKLETKNNNDATTKKDTEIKDYQVGYIFEQPIVPPLGTRGTLLVAVKILSKTYLLGKYIFVLQHILNATASISFFFKQDSLGVPTVLVGTFSYPVDLTAIGLYLVCEILWRFNRRFPESDLGQFSAVLSIVDTILGCGYLLICRVTQFDDEVAHMSMLFRNLIFLYLVSSGFRLFLWFVLIFSTSHNEEVKSKMFSFSFCLRGFLHCSIPLISVLFIMLRRLYPKECFLCFCYTIGLERILCTILNAAFIKTRRTEFIQIENTELIPILSSEKLRASQTDQIPSLSPRKKSLNAGSASPTSSRKTSSPTVRTNSSSFPNGSTDILPVFPQETVNSLISVASEQECSGRSVPCTPLANATYRNINDSNQTYEDLTINATTREAEKSPDSQAPMFSTNPSSMSEIKMQPKHFAEDSSCNTENIPMTEKSSYHGESHSPNVTEQHQTEPENTRSTGDSGDDSNRRKHHSGRTSRRSSKSSRRSSRNSDRSGRGSNRSNDVKDSRKAVKSPVSQSYALSPNERINIARDRAIQRSHEKMKKSEPKFKSEEQLATVV